MMPAILAGLGILALMLIRNAIIKAVRNHKSTK